MSRTVDERVVSMQFDNKQFENNVQTSLSTLDKLKQSLNLTGAAKGFENIGSAAKSINFSGLSGTVDTVKERFSALEVMAVTALANITNSAVNTGKQMLNSLTVEPIKQGFGEYELKLDSVQTIMASTGESLETVNGYLQELNTYADKTIYSFSDMTSSIGKFTNSGVKLEDAVKAIQGISNEAAVSGANAQQASHAMYNFAQALSSGSVKLIDWKSIENANMATVEFKNELIKTAVELGTVTKEGEKFVSVTEDANGNISDAFTATSMFNDSLSSNWMTSEVLVKTLAKYSDETSELGKKAFAAAQDVKTFSQLMDTLQEAVGSGWATTWEIIFGDFEEAKKLWTSVSNIVGGFIDSQSDARNSLLQEWKDMGGRAALIEAFKNAFNGFKEIILPIKEAFNNIFPPITAKRLTEISEKLKDLTAKFKIGSEMSRNLKNSFSDLFRATKNTFDFLKNAVIMVADAFKEIFPVTDLIGKRFREFGHIVRMLSERFKLNDDAVQNLKSTFKGIFAVIDIVKEAVWALFRNIVPLGEKLGGLPSKILEVTGALGEWFVWLDKSIKENDTFGKALRGIGDFIKNLHTIFKNLFSYLGEKLHLPSISDLTQIIVALVKHLTGAEKLSLFQNTSNALGKIADSTSKLGDSAKKTSDSVKQSIDDVSKKIKENPFVKMLETLWTAIKKVGTAIGKVFGNAINNISKKLSKLSGNELLIILNNLSSLGIGVALSKFVKTFGSPLEKLFDTFSGMGESIGGLADNIGSILNQVGNSLKAYQTQLKAGALQKIAIAIGILAVSILILSSIDKAGLKQATSAITIMFVELMGSLAVLSKISGGMKNMMKTAGVMLAMSFSILILASALKKISKLEPKELIIGLTGLIVTIKMMLYAVKELNKKSGAVMKGAGQLILLAVALRIIASALNSFAKLNMEQTLTGLVGLGGSLLLISLILRDMPERNDMIKIGFGLMEIGAALWLMSKALVTIGSMDIEGVGKGLLGMVVGLYAISTAMRTMPRKNMAKIGFGLIEISVGLLIMAQAIKMMGSMNTEDLGKGLLGLFVGLNSISMALQNMPTGIAKKAAGLIILAVALLFMEEVIKKLGSLDFFTLGKGLIGMSVGLLSMTMAMRNMPNAKRIAASSSAIVAISKGLEFMAKAIKEIGSMSLQDVAEGVLAITVALAAIVVAIRDMPDEKKTAASSAGITAIARALEPMAKAIKEIGSMSLQDIGEGILGIVVALFAVAAAVRYMPDPKKTAASIAGFVAVVGTFRDIAFAMKEIGSLKWDEFVRGMAGLNLTVITLVVALEAMQDAKVLLGAAALVIASTAIMIFVPAIMMLSRIGWDGLAISLIAIAGAFAILGVSAKILGKMAPQILSMSFSIASLGISIGVSLAGIAMGMAAFGAGIAGVGLGILVFGLGLQELAIGLTTFGGSLVVAAVELVAAMGIIVASMDDIILPLIDKLVVVIIALLKGIVDIIKELMPDIREVIKETLEMIFGIIIDLLQDIVKYVPDIVVLVLDLVVKVLEGLVDKLPEIIDLVLVLLIQIIDGIIIRLPELVKSIVNLFIMLFASVFDALAEIDPKIFEKVLLGIGEISLIIVAMSGISTLIPSAMSGVLGMAAFVFELTAVLTALGALAQIPGLMWIIGEGGNLLEGIGNAIGKFVGGIVGGIMEGISSSFPKIGTDLSAFMENAKPFIDGAKNVDADAMNGVKALADVILTLTAANILDGLTSWFTGGTSLADFGKELATFGPEFKKYCDSIDGIDGEKVQASANAAKALSEMADNLPTHGGVKGWWNGDSSLSSFAEELADFAPSLVEYSQSVEGLSTDVVENSATAAKALFAMADNLPKHGGFTGWVKGDNTLTSFAKELKAFGPALKSYAESVEGLDTEVVRNSVNAARVIAKFSENLPKHGGMVEWFTGSNKLSDFAKELPEFGYGMHLYWLEVDGIDSEIVESSANAAKALAELANITPNTGGMASWFTGEKSVSAFGEQLQAFGAGIQAYANEVTGIKPEVVTSSVNAAESLVTLSEKLSNQGGVFSFFAGDKNIGVFGERLVIFGEKFAAYADKIKEVKPETLSATTAAASSLVDLQNDLGDDGGLFSNSKTIADFGEELNKFGGFFKTFYANIKDVKPEQLKNVLAEINKIVELAKGLNKLNTEGMKNFGEGLKAVASGAIQDFIKEFDNAKSKIEKAANDMLDNFRTAVNGNKLIFQETFSSLAQDCVNGLYDKNDKFTVAGKDVIGYFMDGVLSMNNDIVSSAQKAMNGFINGIGSKKGDVQFEAVTVVIFAVSAIKDKYNDFYSAGIYLIDGFILGIKSNISKVENTAKEMANTAAQASKKALDEHSPSRVGYEIGAFFGMGFVNALSDYSDKSYSAGENVALSAKNGLNQAISKIADTVDRDMDIQPTIRPVVDLSEVRKSADSIGSMFGATRSVNLASMAGIGVNTVNANVQNEVRLNNDNIIREMRDLKKDISNLSQTVGRMKIVMDTGALVGAIATPINNELGRQSIYYKRGN